MTDKNGKLANRNVRISEADLQRYKDAQADRSIELLYENPLNLTGDDLRAWRHQRMNEFRRQWLDDFYKTREY